MTASSPDQLSDNTLVQKSLEDLDKFGMLIERYEEKLKRYILRISHFTIEEAEEILQEVFIKAWKNLREFDYRKKVYIKKCRIKNLTFRYLLFLLVISSDF